MIPLMKVHAPNDVGSLIQRVWDSGFVTEGEYSDTFEKHLSEYLGNPNTCLVNSCTSALVLAARAISIGPGDEVISTAMTCMATNGPFHDAGAKLVFADIEIDTGNIDVSSIESKITDKTKAIIVVHWAGQPCDMNEICALASKYNLKVVEDAAHAIGAVYNGEKIGSHGDFVCFSFQAVKHLTTGDGGAIACKSEEDAKRIRKLRWFGLDRQYKCASRWEQDIKEYGYKFHMNNMNAIIGIEQLKTIDGLLEKHRKNANFLRKSIDNEHAVPLVLKENRISSDWIFSVLVKDKEEFRSHMASGDVGSDVAHVNNLRYTVFENYRDENLHQLNNFDSRLMNVPCGWWVSELEIERIADLVNSYGK